MVTVDHGRVLDYVQKELGDWFLNSHSRVHQFGVGQHDGCVLAHRLLMSMLPPPSTWGSAPIDCSPLSSPLRSPPLRSAAPSVAPSEVDYLCDLPLPENAPLLPLLASQASRSPLPLAAEWLGDSSVELQPCDFPPLTGQALSALPRYDVLPSAHVTSASAAASTGLPSPVAVISLDTKNAFNNAISRQAVYNSVSGVESRAYSNGRVPVGCAFGSPNPLFPFMPMIPAYYGSVAQL